MYDAPPFSTIQSLSVLLSVMPPPLSIDACDFLDFGGGRINEDGKYEIESGLLGFVNSCYQLGSIFGVPIAPYVAQRWGRRWSIMIGSMIMVAGAIIQGFSQHGKSLTIRTWLDHPQTIN